MSQQSGQWQSKELINGGPATLRRAIYTLAFIAIRFNSDFKSKYEQLVATDKA